MAESIISEVISIFSDLFNVSPEELGPESSPDTVEGWDSLQQVNIVLDVEQRFNITLSPPEIEEMLTVQDIVGIVNKKMRDV
ncbi:MAG: acyl carrier protein [Candidatus Scalindua sp.]|jgi:acyl carrier protein|nr:acyl carrier protein [Candidatus Scalindua sp.]MBT5306889.1 acyl carrier protein [Candidatus Scalindua sp.]MBT6229651.1 acyl carrier protein [Candidatus Scalindua sp.]MBT6565192.1 acyl carrier protein [Candidatus Scalindua sp.]MBT7212525.1 acyl carrier protein [Candidatus Scalindua sp.]